MVLRKHGNRAERVREGEKGSAGPEIELGGRQTRQMYWFYSVCDFPRERLWIGLQRAEVILYSNKYIY